MQQEIYTNALTEFADILLPAATWGEEDFARMQGERRLRLYSKFMDAPGEAKPDWWIAAQVAMVSPPLTQSTRKRPCSSNTGIWK